MVKSMLLVFENIDISKFGRLKLFIKKHSVGHQAKQAEVLTREQLYQFIKNAPDKEYLLTKVRDFFCICEQFVPKIMSIFRWFL